MYIEKGLSVTRKTAASYLATLEQEGFLSSEKLVKREYLLIKDYMILQKEIKIKKPYMTH